MTVEPLKPEALYRRCDPAAIPFKSTAEVKPLDGILGQERAVEAIQFGTATTAEGFNLFLFGPPGTGKFNTIQRVLEDKAKAEEAPPDWVYVNNFDDPRRPKALSLPAGRGPELKSAVHQLIDDLQAAVISMFESDDYRKRRQVLEETYRQEQQATLENLSKKAREKDIALIMTPRGFALAPTRDGEVISPEVFNKLSEKDRKRWEEEIKKLEEELEEIVAGMPRRNKEIREKLREMNREVTALAVDANVDELRQQFKDLPEIIAFIDRMREDLVENVRSVLGMEDGNVPEEASQTPAISEGGLAKGFGRYEINVIVRNDPENGAPVIYENHPTLANLIGAIEHIEHMGSLVTDFRLIKPGALHKALGGYLILDVRQVLMQPFAWEALKRALKAGHITIESPGKMMSIVSTVSLEPDPVPLKTKIILMGERLLYFLLGVYDPDFPELFKVGADFDDRLVRTAETEAGYGQLVATIGQREEMQPFDKAAVARIVEHAAREAGDSERLSLELAKIRDLMYEANWIAKRDSASTVGRDHVQSALDARVRRMDRLRERSHEAIERGIVLIDTDGEQVGQVNGLAVVQLGGFAFGHPSRITARTWLGKGRVIDIEREVELGGPIHSKGVLILSSYLSANFVPGKPLPLAASIVFEQSYGGVEGDSASSTELYALLSSLADIPVRQSLAVTGSVNQYGHVQAIGGVNEKIEGFFDICNKRGLDGSHGVLIPSSNVKHLMLRQDVIDAVDNGKFTIYPVETIADGIEILTGTPAGERGEDGKFPDGTVFARVEDKLAHYAEAFREFQKPAGDENGNAGEHRAGERTGDRGSI